LYWFYRRGLPVFEKNERHAATRIIPSAQAASIFSDKKMMRNRGEPVRLFQESKSMANLFPIQNPFDLNRIFLDISPQKALTGYHLEVRILPRSKKKNLNN
jgi:hypothetical protein